MPGVAKKAVAKRKPLSFSVDCSKPVEDRIMKVGEFADFLSNNIKVAGKKGASSSRRFGFCGAPHGICPHLELASGTL